jgi:hypothetical protein
MRGAMITARQAMDTIVKYMRDFSEYVPSTDLRLEEIEADDNDEWKITVSYLGNPFDASSERIYKLFRVDGNSSEVRSMKSANFSPF